MKIPGMDEPKKPDVVEPETVIYHKGSTMGPTEIAGRAEIVPANPFDLQAAQAKLNQWEAKAIEISNAAVAFKITNDKDFARAAEMIGQAKALGKDLDRAAEAIYIDAFNFQKSVKNIAKTITQHLTAAQGQLTATSNAYAYQKELDRREKEKKAKAEAEAFQKKLDKDAKKKGVAPVKMQTAPVISKKPESVKTQSGSMSTKMVWTFEFTNFKDPAIFEYVLKVCAGDYLKVAEKAVGKMIKAGMHEGIDGVKFYETAKTQHRAR